MKKLYAVLFLVVCASCSKDFLKPYEDRLVGQWQLVDVDRRGFGGSIGNLPFNEGTFNFLDDGQFTYRTGAGVDFQGTWDLRKRWMSGNCYITESGSNNCDDQRVRSLSVTAVNFTSQEIRTEFFDDIVFTGTDRFKAFIYSGSHTYIFHFRR